MADEMQPIYTSEPARVPDVGDRGEFQTYKKRSVYVPYVQYDSIESLSVYGSMEGVSSIYVNSQQYVLPIPKPLTAGDVWHSKVKSSYDKRIVLDGTEAWKIGAKKQKELIMSNFVSATTKEKQFCSHAAFEFNLIGAGFYIYENILVFGANYTGKQLSLDEFKAYLASQKAAGTPVVVYYQSTAYDGTNGLTVSVADYQSEIYVNNFVDIFTDDGELWVDGGDFAEVAVNNIVLNGMTNDERAGEYGTPQVHTFP